MRKVAAVVPPPNGVMYGMGTCTRDLAPEVAPRRRPQRRDLRDLIVEGLQMVIKSRKGR